MNKSKILVSSKNIKDDFFEHSVILLLEEYGGVILNIKQHNYLTKALNTIVIALKGMNLASSVEYMLEKIRLGGPATGPMICIHKIPNLGKEIIPGLYWTHSLEQVTQVLLMPQVDCRLYFGMCLWSEGQLENEIKSGIWNVAPCKTEYVFNDGDRQNVWESINKDRIFKFYEKIGIKKQNYQWN